MPVNTKVMIAQALQEINEEKSLDKITIKDLVDRCNISRQTFYYHFKDIFEVLEWAIEQDVQKTLALSLDAEDPEAAIRVFLNMSGKNRMLIEKMLHSQRRPQIEAMFVDGLKVYLREMLRHRVPNLSMTYSDIEVALNFYTYGIAGLLLGQRGDGARDVDKTAKQIYQLITGTYLKT